MSANNILAYLEGFGFIKEIEPRELFGVCASGNSVANSTKVRIANPGTYRPCGTNSGSSF